MKPAHTYILNQKEPFRTILIQLQCCIETTIPDAKLLFKYRIPFYYLANQPFCYLNTTKKYVDLGFSHGSKLTKHVEILLGENRKLVRSLRYFEPNQIDETILETVLTEAKHIIRNA